MKKIIDRMEEYANVICWIAVSAVVLFGFVYSIILGNHFYFDDERQYFILAMNLAKSQVYSLHNFEPTAWRPPGYSFFMAPFVYFGATPALLRVLNFIVLACSLRVLFLVLRRFHPLAGVIGILLFFTYPVLLYTAGTLYPQTLVGLFLLLSVWIMFRDTDWKRWSAAVIGVLYGLMMLTVPTFLAPFFITLIWSGKKWWIVFLSAMLVMSPWFIRNTIVFERFVFVSTNGGLHLMIGNAPNYKVGSGVSGTLIEREDANVDDEVLRDRFYRNKGLEFIAEDPGRAIILYAKKLINYFSAWNLFSTQSVRGSWYQDVMLISYGTLLGIAILRLFFSFQIPWIKEEVYLGLLYIGYGALLALFFTRIRFRIPLDLLLITFNSIFIYRLLDSKLIGTIFKK